MQMSINGRRLISIPAPANHDDDDDDDDDAYRKEVDDAEEGQGDAERRRRPAECPMGHGRRGVSRARILLLLRLLRSALIGRRCAPASIIHWPTRHCTDTTTSTTATTTTTTTAASTISTCRSHVTRPITTTARKTDAAGADWCKRNTSKQQHTRRNNNGGREEKGGWG